MGSDNRAIDLWSAHHERFDRGVASESGGRYPARLSALVHDLEVRAIRHAVRFTGRERLVDIGAGGGRFTVSLAPFVGSVLACEPSTIYDVLRRNTAQITNVTCRPWSCTNMPEDLADVVLISGLLMYLSPALVAATFAKVARMVVPGGYLIARDPVATRPHVLLDWAAQYAPVSDETVLASAYYEYVRPEGFYISVAHDAGWTLQTSFVSHSPLLYHVPRWVPLRSHWQRLIDSAAGLRGAAPLAWGYTRSTRTAFRKLRDWQQTRSMRLYVYRKAR